MAGTYQQIVLNERPAAEIVPGKTFRFEWKPKPSERDLADGQVLLEILYLSFDPAMRGWLNDKRSYIPPVQIGEVMRAATIARVVATKSSKFAVGALVEAMAGWTEHAILPEQACQPIDLPSNGKVTDCLGLLGFPGMTAYFGMLEIGKPKEGDVVVISGAAGATGSIAGQIAKIKGAKKVIGTAGSDEKCEWLKTIGFDEALNYKAPDFAEKFKEATKDYIDVFFDNVGGEVLDLALARAQKFSRFVMCGGISTYNAADGAAVGPKNYMSIISMRIRMEGFIVFDFIQKFPEAKKQVATWLEKGKIQRKETIIKGGLKVAEDTLCQLFKGINTGKLLVEVKPETPASKI